MLKTGKCLLDLVSCTGDLLARAISVDGGKKKPDQGGWKGRKWRQQIQTIILKIRGSWECLQSTQHSANT